MHLIIKLMPKQKKQKNELNLNVLMRVATGGLCKWGYKDGIDLSEDAKFDDEMGWSSESSSH